MAGQFRKLPFVRLLLFAKPKSIFSDQDLVTRFSIVGRSRCNLIFAYSEKGDLAPEANEGIEAQGQRKVSEHGIGTLAGVQRHCQGFAIKHRRGGHHNLNQISGSTFMFRLPLWRMFADA